MDTNTCLIDNLEENKEKEFIYEIVKGYNDIITELYLRIDKAIEYIENNTWEDEYGGDVIEDYNHELLKILKGEENGK